MIFLVLLLSRLPPLEKEQDKAPAAPHPTSTSTAHARGRPFREQKMPPANPYFRFKAYLYGDQKDAGATSERALKVTGATFGPVSTVKGP